MASPLEQTDDRHGIPSLPQGAELRVLAAAAEHSTNIIFLTDAFGTIQYVNPMFERSTGWDKDAILGQSSRLLDAAETPQGRFDEMWETITSGEIWRGTLKNKRRDGLLWWSRAVVTPILDDAGRPIHHLAVHEDVTWLRICSERVEELVTHDSLTGLPNRIYLIEELNAWVARGAGDDAAVLLVNIDDFRSVNRFGDPGAGDELLLRIAELLRDLTAESGDKTDAKYCPGTAARLYGDEFCIFVPNCERQRVLALGDAIRQAVTGAGGRHVSASIGVAFHAQPAMTCNDLMMRADIALCRAKDLGGDRLYVHQPEDGTLEVLHSRFDQKKLVLRGLAENAFVPWFQPILHIESGTISKYEALARMIEPDGTVVGPHQFIPGAEQFGLIGSLQRMITRKTVQQQVELAQRGRSFNFAVNLSGKEMGSLEVLEFLQDEIRATGVDPNCLTFEITETAAIADLEKAKEFVGALKHLGCHFSLDDFGVGFSSFRYLRELQVDCVKIDGSFISKMHESTTDFLLVRAMTDVARGMGIEIVAEFVEEEQTLTLLRLLGVDYAQGYLIGRPAPASELWGAEP